MLKKGLTIIKLCLIFSIILFYPVASSLDKESITKRIFNTEKHKILLKSLRKQGFFENELWLLFSNKDFNPNYKCGVVPLAFSEFKKKVMTKESIDRGLEFIKENEEILDRIEKKYGVKKEDIASLYRVETNFGSNNGECEVLNFFFTQYYSKNINEAKEQIIALLVFAKKNQLNPYNIRGSYAGAFGLFQFMPLSCKSFVIDADADGKIDLFSLEDAISSAANYLDKNGYKKGSFKARKRAFRRYNNSENYAKLILLYSKELEFKKKLKNKK